MYIYFGHWVLIQSWALANGEIPFFDEDLIFSIEGNRTGNSLSGTGTVWKETMRRKDF